ncbi:MAG: FtsW/RodA/SpoVE family cell cycle protein [Dehalococcoidia bacterium]|nr:FtsW/RodA/SpoVE family cell cycle protein [Dehalococcoidia bacterium]
MRTAIRRSDLWLLASVLLLAPFGVLMVQSATLRPGARELSLTPAAARQLALVIAGLAAMIGLARIDYRALRRLALPLYGGTIVLLAVVLLIGITQFGARRWLGVGGATVQPSELAKIAIPVMLAAYLADRPRLARTTPVAVALLAAPLALVVVQPDTGTTLVLGSVWVAMLIVWGAPWRVLGTLFAIALAMVPLLFALAVPGYQRERIAVFLDPGRDPLGSGFNLQQAEAALRSGGLTGRGLFGGEDSALAYVNARSSDFMLSHVGEELGLIGGLATLALVTLLVWRGLSAARTAPDRFGRLLATGLTAAVFTQAAIHAAANLRALPASGIPLPFVSQGGSSLLVMCIAAGLLQSIAAHRMPDPREQWGARRWR